MYHRFRHHKLYLFIVLILLPILEIFRVTYIKRHYQKIIDQINSEALAGIKQSIYRLNENQQIELIRLGEDDSKLDCQLEHESQIEAPSSVKTTNEASDVEDNKSSYQVHNHKIKPKLIVITKTGKNWTEKLNLLRLGKALVQQKSEVYWILVDIHDDQVNQITEDFKIQFQKEFKQIKDPPI